MNETGLKILKSGKSVVALHEIRWHGQGQINKDHTLFFSRPKNSTGQLGTGFMIKMKTKKNPTGFEPISERLWREVQKHQHVVCPFSDRRIR
jgi:hypothetical protein